MRPSSCESKMARNASCKRCDIVSSSLRCHMDGDSMEWQVFQALRRLGADRAAMTLSGLCLVHCLAGIVLFSTFTVLGYVLVSPLFHAIGLGLAIVLASWTLWRGYLLPHPPVPTP